MTSVPTGPWSLVLDDDIHWTDLVAHASEGLDPVQVTRSVVVAQDALAGMTRVISDWKMPDADGLRFLLSVRENFPQIECILLTGFVHELEESFGRDSVASLEGIGIRVLAKPTNPGKFLKELLTAAPSGEISHPDPLALSQWQQKSHSAAERVQAFRRTFDGFKGTSEIRRGALAGLLMAGSLACFQGSILIWEKTWVMAVVVGFVALCLTVLSLAHVLTRGKS